MAEPDNIKDRSLDRKTIAKEQWRWWRRGKKGRVADSLIALSSMAVVSVYAVGYVHTRNATPPPLVAATGPVATAAVSPAAPSGPSITGARVPAVATRTPTPVPSATKTYNDGTYVGLGNSRHGGIEATVVVEGGRIVSASVSRCMTRYSCSDVNSLVREALSRQGVPVNHVSGATDSSNAYKQAIANALAKAA
jgi:uncharacterized protein with FMN-binding domain